jgi:proteic killer suppression protein
MIKSWKHKGLRELFEKGTTAKIQSKLHERIIQRLDILDASMTPEDMNVPGYDFHALKGFKPTRYTVHVNGPWCITFEFDGTDAAKVDFEQYH